MKSIRYFFHGTEKDFLHLDIAKARKGSPLGPGIYLTEDLEIAKMYSGDKGFIHKISLNFDPVSVIFLDEKLCRQSILVRNVVFSLYIYLFFIGKVNNFIAKINNRPNFILKFISIFEKLSVPCVTVLKFLSALCMFFRIYQLNDEEEISKIFFKYYKFLPHLDREKFDILRNRILREFNIDLMCGEINSMNNSGFRDKGVQFVVLNPSIIIDSSKFCCLN